MRDRCRHLSGAATGTWERWQLDPFLGHSGMTITAFVDSLGCLSGLA